MSRTSVFNYFGHKEMILCEIGARYVREIAGPLRTGEQRDPGRAFREITDALAELAIREPALISAVARETMHPDPERRRCARETMGYSELVTEMLDSFAEQGALRHPEYRDSYSNQIVDLLSGVLIRLAGTASRDELRREIGRSLELFMRGAMQEPAGATAPSVQLVGA
jgi:AcrR family transcriptional regulator